MQAAEEDCRATSPRRRVVWRPPARVWLRLAAKFQPGLATARTEAAAKDALAAGVADMVGTESRLGAVWGDFSQSLAAWTWVDRLEMGVLRVEESGLPTHLDLAGLKLRGPLSAQLCRLKSLTHLDLGFNRLTELPDAICGLTFLTYFSLGLNQLTALPDSIRSLSSLKGLYLSGNQLTVLPDAICDLTNLERLCLTGNRLTTLPAAIHGLKNLMYLYLSVNQLTALPDAIEHLSSLIRFDLSDNLFRSKEKRRIIRVKDRCFPGCVLDIDI